MNTVRTKIADGPVQIPAELLRSVPRDCRLTAGGKVLLGLAVAMILGAVAFGVGVYISTTRATALKKEMASQGQIAQAVVIKTYRTGDENSRRDVFLYQFVVGEQIHNGRTDINAHGSPRYPVGSSVPVRYLPTRPDVNWIEGHSPRSMPLFVIPLFAAGMLAGAYAIFFSVRRQKALVGEGRAALAKVKKVQRVLRGEHKKKRAYIEFTLLNGSRQESHVDFGGKAIEPDSTIVIVYDAENPRRVLRYPSPLVRVEKPEDW